MRTREKKNISCLCKGKADVPHIYHGFAAWLLPHLLPSRAHYCVCGRYIHHANMFTKMKSAEEAPLIPNSTSPERQSQHHEYDNNQERYQRTALFPERSTSRSLLLSVIVALGILAVTTGSATLIFPRGASSWAPSTITGAADSSQIGGKDTEAFLLKRSSNRTTEQCAGDAALPVLRGVDVVAYYSIEAGASAVYGYEEYEAIINGYRFYFASKENKELFEVSEVRVDQEAPICVVPLCSFCYDSQV